MTKRLLIDASHAEETRVVVLDGNRLEDFDVETVSRRQLKGNIYLAKVVRVEPSLQAAFVEYGGNRHGFLAFGEIHPDYYQIPVADRQRLLEMQEEEARAEEEAEEDSAAAAALGDPAGGTAPTGDDTTISAEPAQDGAGHVQPLEAAAADSRHGGVEPDDAPVEGSRDDAQAPRDPLPGLAEPDLAEPDLAEADLAELGADVAPEAAEQAVESQEQPEFSHVRQVEPQDVPAPETLGGDTETAEETRPSRQPSRFMRSYKIQEVIRRRQILLVQVVKEERGTKGAALTTYISLAGRYCVLMPNSPRGGGISRKITSAADRRRLKEVTTELDIPRGMGLIVRTAGAARPKPEIKRDGEYLLRLWDDIREKTLQSIAPALIHEEASLIKRAIRDVYSRDVEELLVDGEDGWRAARDYMRMLMPTHVKKVQLWPSGAQPLFAHSQVESMLDAMLSPTVQLRSGGYLVINQTEALVAIDVNSGRSTRERGIEETALRTNLEAAEEAARQLRLRDLAGLIVIDFIDMESKKHNFMVERRMADALKNDRARIQIGHISHFGLLELSRQRLRPSLAETSLNVCAACGGSGHVRSTESAALHVLREIEEEGGKRRAAEIMVHVAGATALYILNNKRQRLTEIETRYGMRVCFAGDETLLTSQTRIDRLRAAGPQDLPELIAPRAQSMPEDDAGEADIDDDEDDVVMSQTRVEAGASVAEALGDPDPDPDHVPGETAAEGEQRRRRRRRRRRGGRREDGVAADSASPMPDDTDQPEIPALDLVLESALPVPGHDGAAEAVATVSTQAGDQADTAEPARVDGDAEPAKAKRGRRGGRRRRKPGEEADAAASQDGAAEAPAAFSGYAGPTPADPFAMAGLDIFEAIEQAEFSSARLPQPGTPATPATAPQIGDAEHGVPAEGRVAPSHRPESSPDMTVDADTTDADTTGPDTTEPDTGEPNTGEPDTTGPDTTGPDTTGPGVLAAPVRDVAADPVVGLAVQPVLVGVGEVAVERKRGWWRR